MYFFTGDEHYGHVRICEYTGRPFQTVEEMDEALISNHNEIVGKNDIVVHMGDFTLAKKDIATKYIKRLKGSHIFLKGSHDRWLTGANQIWEKKIDDLYIVVCHYAMRTWPRSHYGSYQLYGHSHGTLDPIGLQWDVGVDNNNFYPVPLDDLRGIMSELSRSQRPSEQSH